MSPLVLQSVSKHYGDRTALDAASVSFEQGVITAVIGPSGCGKSTLLKLINGLVRPDSGQVQLFGQAIDYTALAQVRRRIGYAVQGTGLFPHLSGRDNIILLAQLEGWTEQEIEQRLGELLHLTHLQADLLGQYPHELSGGQQQRVGLCRAMMLRPEVMLLDEPFAAIDPITRTDIHQQLLELHRAEPSTTVLVTHDMREALKLAQQVVVMNQGRVLYNETTKDLLRQYGDTDPEQLLQTLLAGVNQ